VGQWKIAAIKMEHVFDERGWVTIKDAREITKEVGGNWSPRTLLQRNFVAAAENDPDNARGKKWITSSWKGKPSKKYLEAVTVLEKK